MLLLHGFLSLPDALPHLLHHVHFNNQVCVALLRHRPHLARFRPSTALSTARRLFHAQHPLSSTHQSKSDTKPSKAIEYSGKTEFREDVRTLPNLITISRIALSPVVGYLIASGNYGWGLIAFGIAGVSDLLDGWIARRFAQQTVLGTILDPLADKVLMTTLTVSLWWGSLLPDWLAIVIIGRDVGLTLGAFYVRWISLQPPRTFARYWDFTLPSAEVRPTSISKINTALQLSLMGGSLAAAYLEFQGWIGMDILRLVVGVTTVWSGAQYLLANNSIRIIRQTRAKPM
ncbi:hypothetical protein HDU93_009693 [Gonapodya sp. JEL0774]|nr:hypothetical protein HDU93_009693 [Gonapodya sp. JEL0774]